MASDILEVDEQIRWQPEILRLFPNLLTVPALEDASHWSYLTKWIIVCIAKSLSWKSFWIAGSENPIRRQIMRRLSLMSMVKRRVQNFQDDLKLNSWVLRLAYPRLPPRSPYIDIGWDQRIGSGKMSQTVVNVSEGHVKSLYSIAEGLSWRSKANYYWKNISVLWKCNQIGVCLEKQKIRYE